MTAPGCLAPATCPVPDPTSADLRRLRLAHLDVGRRMFRVHRADQSADRFADAAAGSRRFAPLPGVGHLYLADTRTTALLETVFHEVHETTPRVVYTATALAGRALSAVTVTRRMPLIDLRDPALERIGTTRAQLVATTPAHHACTRRWARRLAERRVGGVRALGIVWNSRIAELAGDGSPLLADVLAHQPSEVAVLYRPPTHLRAIRAAPAEHADLKAGHGRVLIDEIAELLGAEVH